MQVIVDTCVWSQALRRKNNINQYTDELREIISDNRVCMIGPIRQEILSGVRLTQDYKKLREHLSAFPDLLIKTRDYEKAAEFSNLARGKGIQGSPVDFLICSVAYHYSLLIYTIDADFKNFSNYIPIKWYA